MSSQSHYYCVKRRTCPIYYPEMRFIFYQPFWSSSRERGPPATPPSLPVQPPKPAVQDSLHLCNPAYTPPSEVCQPHPSRPQSYAIRNPCVSIRPGRDSIVVADHAREPANSGGIVTRVVTCPERVLVGIRAP